MVSKLPLKKTIFVLAVIIVIALNLYTLIAAYPESTQISAGINLSGSGSNLAKDFSAYYIAAWRLWHDPSHIYTIGGLADGEPMIFPQPETYKYLPSFLLIVSPFLSLSYQQALLAFDIVQFLLLPIMAYMLYKMLGNKPLAVTFIIILIALLLPYPAPNGGLSLSYYWQWAEGQAKVFVTFLLLLSFYLGFRGKPVLSGIVFAFGFFDPRFGLLAIPLFVTYNCKKLKVATVSAIGMMVVSNAMLLYPSMGLGFISMAFNSTTTPLYYYSFIPLFTLIALTVVNAKEVVAAFFSLIRKNNKTLEVGQQG